MDNFEPYVLCDTGNEYYFYDGTVCRYGELLKGLATLSRSSIKNVFYEMSLKQYLFLSQLREFHLMNRTTLIIQFRLMKI